MASSPSAAVPFIRVNEATGAYEVTAEGRAMFNDVMDPFGVVSVAGKYRTGKSFVLNRCFLQISPGTSPGEGFPVGSTVNSCTRGLWMKKAPASSGRDGRPTAPLALYVMDTEGIGALDASGTGDTRIFALALLLSSYFVYNSTNVIDEDAIAQLSLVTNVCRSIRISDAPDGEAADATAAAMELGSSGAFPSLMWMVRDFTLQLRRRDGAPMSPTEYLESALEDRPEGSTDDVADRNTVRKCIRAAFPTRSCVTVVRPASDEKVLHDLSSAPDSALKEMFVRQMDYIRKHVFATISPMKAGGTMPLSGAAYVRYAELLCEAINSGRAPVLRNAWILLAELKTREAVAAGMAAYETSNPGTDADHESAVVAATDEFGRVSCGVEPHVAGPARATLVRTLEDGWPRRRAAAYAALATGLIERLPQLAGTGKLRAETSPLADRIGGRETVARALWEVACSLDERIGDADELRCAAEVASAAAAAATAELNVAIARAEEAERKLEESLSIENNAGKDDGDDGPEALSSQRREREKGEDDGESERDEQQRASEVRRMRLAWEAESARLRDQVARAVRRAIESETAAREASIRCEEIRRASAEEAIAHRAEVATLQADKMASAVETVTRVAAAERRCVELEATTRELKRKLGKCDPMFVKRLRLEHRDVQSEAQRLRAELTETRAVIRDIRFSKERELTEALLRYGGTYTAGEETPPVSLLQQ